MNRRVFFVAVVVLIVTVAVFVYRSRFRDESLPQGPSVGTSLPSQASSPSMNASSSAGSRDAKANSVAGGSERQVVVQGAWGSGPGQFGHRRAAESNPEGPMALSVAPDGSVLIVDQINHRIERFKDGRAVGSMALGGDTVQDLALGPEGRVVVLDRFVDRGVQVYGPDGKLLSDVPLHGKLELGSLTGVFADDQGVYVEREHGQVVRIADANGNRIEGERELSGRPSRDGQLVLSAALLERHSGQLLVRAHDRAKGTQVWERVVQLPTPILHMVMLDSDRLGRIYVAAVTAIEEQTPPYQLSDESLFAVQLGRDGQERGRLKLPPLHGSDESFRPVTIDDAGNLYVMQSSESGLTVVRYAFP